MVQGSYYKTISSGHMIDNQCPHCGTKSYMQLKIVCKINHVMFIPCFATKKQIVYSCQICNKMYLPSAFPEHFEEASKLLNKTRYPWYSYIGSALFFLFASSMLLLIYNGSRERDIIMSDLLNNIHGGNTIFYKLDNGYKTSMYVVMIKNDTVLVNENVLSTNKSVYDIDKDNNYSEVQSLYTKTQLKDMLKQNIIFDIY